MGTSHEQQWNRWYRLTVWCTVIATVLFVLWLADAIYVISGHRHLFVQYGDTTAYVTSFAPEERERIRGVDDATGDPFLLLTKQNVHFDVLVPRPFTKINVGVWFRNTTSQQQIDMTVTGQDGETIVRPLVRNHPVLRTLAADGSGWSVHRMGDRVLWQRGTIYPDVATFLAQPPDATRTRFLWSDPRQFASAREDLKPITMNHPLRGAHVFNLFLPDGVFTITTSLSDLNQKAGPDETRIGLETIGGLTVAFARLEDDGTIVANENRDPARSLVLTGTIEHAGWHRLRIVTTNDVLLRSLETSPAIILAEKQLTFAAHLLDTPKYATTTLYGTAPVVTIRANDLEGLQTVHTGARSQKLNKTEQAMTINAEPFTGAIVLEKDTVVVKTDGLLAFEPITKDPFLAFVQATPDEVASMLDELDYLLVLDPQLEERDGWTVASATLEGDWVSEDLGRSFTLGLSLPEMNGAAQDVKLNALELDLQKPPLTLTSVLRRFGLR